VFRLRGGSPPTTEVRTWSDKIERSAKYRLSRVFGFRGEFFFDKRGDERGDERGE
jgi:hypothetical protein